MEVVRVYRDLKNIKKPKLLPDNSLVIFAHKKLCFKPAEYQKNDSGVLIALQDKIKGYYWLLDGDIADLNTGENRLHFGFLNQTFTLSFTLEKGKTIGFVRQFSDSEIKLNMPRKTSKRKSRRPYSKGRHRDSFLNRYDLDYVGGDVVNQLGKIAPGVIKEPPLK